MPGLDGFRIAYRIAQEAHKDQKRWGGEPYMTHIDAVIENTYLLHFEFYKHFNDKSFEKNSLDPILMVAALHDVIEDQSDKFSIEDLKKILFDFIDRIDYRFVIPSIIAITKIAGEEYWQYLKRVDKYFLSRTVKKADLLHNMSDLARHKKKDKLDKYKLAYAILDDQML